MPIVGTARHRNFPLADCQVAQTASPLPRRITKSNKKKIIKVIKVIKVIYSYKIFSDLVRHFSIRILFQLQENK